MAGERDDRGGRGLLVRVGWRLLLVTFVLVGAWVTISRAYGWARPALRYLTVASVAFALGAAWGRRRRD